jgi:hypothetical protein
MKWSSVVLLFVIGCLSAAWQMNWMPEAALGRGFEPVQTALALADGRGFSDAFGAGTGPTAHVAPFYPAWLALWLQLLGHNGTWAVTVTCWTIACHGLIVALLPLVSRKALGNPAPGVWASVLLMVLPLVPVIPQFEVAVGALAVLAYCLLPVRPGWRGTAAGLIFHINPAALFVLAPQEMFNSKNFRRWLLAAALVCLPWTIRNYREFGQLMFIRSNLPLELQVSNNDLAGASLYANGPSLAAYHPTTDAAEAARLKKVGEAVYQKDKLRVFAGWVKDHFGKFAVLSMERVCLFWFPVSAFGWPHQLALWSVTLLGLAGLRFLPPSWKWVLLVYPLPYYFVQSDPRYRYLILWISVLGAGVVLNRLAGASQMILSRKKLRTDDPKRGIAAGGVALEDG